MAAGYSGGVGTSQTIQRVSIKELEKATEQVTQEVLEREQELKGHY